MGFIRFVSWGLSSMVLPVVDPCSRGRLWEIRFFKMGVKLL